MSPYAPVPKPKLSPIRSAVSAILTIFALIGAIELCRDIAAGRSALNGIVTVIICGGLAVLVAKARWRKKST